MDRRQPNFNFHFPLGIDVIEIPSFKDDNSITMLGVAENRMELLRLRVTPAELYCDFPDDQPNSVYSILMKYNSSHCTYVKNEDSLYYGST